VRSLGRGQSAGNGFRLGVIGPAVHLLEHVDGWQHKRRTKASGKPRKCPGSETRPQSWHALIDRSDLALPELGMSLLDRTEAGVPLRVRLGHIHSLRAV